MSVLILSAPSICFYCLGGRTFFNSISFDLFFLQPSRLGNHLIEELTHCRSQDGYILMPFWQCHDKRFLQHQLTTNEWCFYCRKLNVTINSIDTSATNWNATFCPVRRFNRTHWLFYCSRYLFPHRPTIRHVLWPVDTIAFKHILRFRLLCDYYGVAEPPVR